MAKTAGKKVTVVLDIPDEKGKVVKYSTEEEGVAMTNAYIDKDALKEVGGGKFPKKVRVTIEAA